MALSNRMNESAAKSDSVMGKGNARTFKLNERVKFWANVPGIGNGITKYDEATQRNLACFLDNQAAHMSRLTETQVSTSFSGFTPENMLRLVRLAMPNVVRSKIFTEFAMETARDSIKYIKPVYSKTQSGKSLDDRTDFARIYEDADGTNDINREDARRAIYETTADRINQELANIEASIDDGGAATFEFKEIAGKEETKKWGANGEHYIDGYGVIYGKDEKDVIAVQDKRTKNWFIAGEYVEKITKVENLPSAKGVKITPANTVTLYSTKAAYDAEYDKADETAKKTFAETNLLVKAYARFDSEGDFMGDYLGEVEIRMSDYEFKPRPTTIGVTWSQLSELTLDASFGVSAEEYLVTYAAAAIKQELDYRAIRIAYMAAKTNPAAYHVTFDAAYNTANADGTAANGTKEGYRDNAQTFLSAVATVGDIMYNDIKRGGVSRLVCGPSAGTYIRLNNLFSNKGAMPAEGAHQFGELDGIPTFKVPDEVIPTDEILTVWKNPSNEADISVAFGTFVPFFSTGVIQRKNFYKEAGLATYGDWAILNRRYLATIKIKNLKDTTN